MRRLGWVWVTAVFCGIGWAQNAPQNRREAKSAASGGPYVITGVVVNSVNGSPVTHCRMTPSPSGRPGMGGGGGGNRQFPAPSNDGVDCDAGGRFTVTVPSAGAWRLTASARGFVSAAYDQHEQFSSAVVLTAASPTKELVFRLSPEATVTGVVLDEASEPIRNAQIMLQSVPAQVPGGLQPSGAMRSSGRTDDRGRYELSNLAPGEYRLSVTAQPWYAAGSQVQRGGPTNATSSLDPSLDFTYAQTWFPGVDDPLRAEGIKLHAGDTREADFNMVPIPSIHLRIVVPPRVQTVVNVPPGSQSGLNASTPSAAPIQVPMVQRISPGAFGGGFVQTSVHFESDGQVDVGGLTPGTYQVRLMGPNQDGRSALVEVTANSARTVDMSAPSSDMARITVHVDGSAADPEEDAGQGEGRGRNFGVQVSLIDVDTRRGSFSTMNGQQMGNGGRSGQRDPNADRVIEAPPGRYEVVLQGRGNVFLTGLAAKGAETAGRYVTVGAGESTLTVHTASGRASVSGMATMDGKPVAGAMMLLVPVTIEDPNSITVLRQDQTNTDGSFDIANIIPGQYILVGVDHGWGVNWGDASTLRRYLMQGVPLELKSSAVAKQNVEAQSP